MVDRGNYWTGVFKRRHSRRSFLGTALGVGAGLSMIGCAGESAKPAPAATPANKGPKSGGIINIGEYADAPDLDPHLSTNLPMLDVGNMVYSGLLRFKTGGGDRVSEWEMVPDLAEKWEQPDAATYVLHLRQGVKWHDGTDFTPDDVRATLQRIATPQAQFQRNYMFEPVTKMEAPDKATLRISLKEPFAPFMNYIANPWNKVAAKHVIEKEGDLKKVAMGTGPFTIKEYKRDVGWTLVKNPNYFIKGRPYMDGVNLNIQPDGASRLSSFRASQSDIVDENVHLYSDQVDQLKKSFPGLGVEKFGNGAWRGLAMRTDKPPFDNLKVRQAVAMTIDYQQLIDTVWQGDGYTPGILPESMKKWAVPRDKLGIPKRDTAKAKQLLAEAGYPNGFKTSGLTTPNHPYGVDFWQVMIPLLKEVGIDVEPRILEFAAYQSARTKGDFEMAHIGFVVYADPDEWLFPFYHTTGTRNAGHFSDPELDKLLEKQRKTTNEAERKKVLEDIQMDLAKKLWFIPIPIEYYTVAWHAHVKGYHSAYSTFRMSFMDEVWLDK